MKLLFPVLVSIILLMFSPSFAGEPETEKPDPMANLKWRNIGPVNMSGRVADVEGIPGNPGIVYVGSASGGIWKSENAGMTFEPIFDDQSIASIGDMALAPSNHEVIYVGSGEANVRNSVSFGNGVYRSTDAGRHWQHMGLEDTRHISRVVVDPSDPQTVYVGALGHIYGPNEQRGVFKSTNGGETWEKVLYLDDKHGVADLDINPVNPNILYAAMWHFDRKPWTHTSGSREGGVFKSIDAGKTWNKITKGLPPLMGRIGVKVAPSDPDVVYVIAESDDGVLFRSDDQGESFTKMTDNVRIVSRGFYYTDLRVDPTDANRVYAISSRLFVSIDGGKEFKRISGSTHVDYHSLWIDPANPNRLWQGQDGGVAVSYDRGDNWSSVMTLPLGQFYQINVDNREPFYWISGGLQDNGTWYGPSRTREPGGIISDDWRMVSFGDAYFTVHHPERPEYMISESQAGGIQRTDMRNRHQTDISPQPRRNDGGPINELKYRFNWNAPIIASPHNPLKVYFAGNVIFESSDFGDTWKVISPDLTTNDPEKMGEAGGPVWKENTTAEYHCTIISFDESPVKAGVLWAGTDDGRLHISRNGGEKWKELQVDGVPALSPVSHIEPSKTDADGAIVAFDRHMFDDLRPYIYRTTNAGRSWKNISGNLPDQAWVWVVRQDPKNNDLLYAGTELGLFASWNGGDHWEELDLGNLPTVSIHDMHVHPRENDLILGTHGRAIWIFDDATPIQQWAGVDKAKPHLFPVRPGMHTPMKFTRYGIGDAKHTAPNPPYGAMITWYLPQSLESAKDKDAKKDPKTKKKKKSRIKLEILDQQGNLVRTLKKLPAKQGLNRAVWHMDTEMSRPRRERREANEFRGPPRGPYVPAGTYTARLTVDGESLDTPVEVRMDPTLSTKPADMQAQYEMVVTLRDLNSQVNDMLRGMDSITQQIKSRQADIKQLKLEPAEGFNKSVKKFQDDMKEWMGSLTRVRGKPFWSQGPKLSGLVGNLMGSVNRSFARPSEAQVQLLEELKGECDVNFDKYRKFLEKDVAEMNQLFTDNKLPPIAIPAFPAQ